LNVQNIEKWSIYICLPTAATKRYLGFSGGGGGGGGG
jgi:hypothetical protein